MGDPDSFICLPSLGESEELCESYFEVCKHWDIQCNDNANSKLLSLSKIGQIVRKRTNVCLVSIDTKWPQYFRDTKLGTSDAPVNNLDL